MCSDWGHVNRSHTVIYRTDENEIFSHHCYEIYIWNKNQVNLKARLVWREEKRIFVKSIQVVTWGEVLTGWSKMKSWLTKGRCIQIVLVVLLCIVLYQICGMYIYLFVLTHWCMKLLSIKSCICIVTRWMYTFKGIVKIKQWIEKKNNRTHCSLDRRIVRVLRR